MVKKIKMDLVALDIEIIKITIFKSIKTTTQQAEIIKNKQLKIQHKLHNKKLRIK